MVWHKGKEGKKEIRTSSEFVKAVVKEVRFAWDRKEISEELKAHIEDLEEEFQSEGIEKEQAQQQAVFVMGDARQVGRALNKEHHFALGCLWLATRAILLILVFSFLFRMDFVKDRVLNWDQQGRAVNELESNKISYSVQDLDRTIEMEHCTFYLKTFIRADDTEEGGYLIYSIKQHWRNGGFINAGRIEVTTDKDQRGELLSEINGKPTAVYNTKGQRILWWYEGRMLLRTLPSDAKVLKLGYHVFGENWDLEIPLKGVGSDA